MIMIIYNNYYTAPWAYGLKTHFKYVHNAWKTDTLSKVLPKTPFTVFCSFCSVKTKEDRDVAMCIPTGSTILSKYGQKKQTKKQVVNNQWPQSQTQRYKMIVLQSTINAVCGSNVGKDAEFQEKLLWLKKDFSPWWSRRLIAEEERTRVGHFYRLEGCVEMEDT